MQSIKHPPKIIFGPNSAKEFDFKDSSLIVTSKGAKSRGWLDYLSLSNFYLFDQVESNPSIEITKIIEETFKNSKISQIVGLGGGSSLDVAKYVAFKLQKPKILIPTTFGSGSEVTRISVLKVEGKKKSFHDDKLFADIALVDPNFAKNTPSNIMKNSVIDALAQCSEGHDSKIGNFYTQFICKKAFDVMEDGILHNDYEKIAFGSLLSGIGFGNCSTTLGHALSYVFSNEGISHGHALAFTTIAAHQFNNSIFYERFVRIVKKLNFEEITLSQDLTQASRIIMGDRKHIDNNPKNVTENDIVYILKKIIEHRLFD